MDINKTKAVGLIFAKPSIQCSIWQKRGQVVVGRDKMEVVGLFLPNRASRCSIWQKRGRWWFAMTNRGQWGLVFANPSIQVLDLAKTGASGNWP